MAGFNTGQNSEGKMKIQFIFTTENNLPYRFLFIIVSPASLNAKSCRCSGPRFRRLDVRNYGVVVVVKFTIGRSQVYQFWIILCCLLIMLFVVKLADCVFSNKRCDALSLLFYLFQIWAVPCSSSKVILAFCLCIPYLLRCFVLVISNVFVPVWTNLDLFLPSCIERWAMSISSLCWISSTSDFL